MRLVQTCLAVAALAAVTMPSVAGGLSPAAVEPVVVVEPVAPRSSWGMILPIALLVGLIAFAVTSNDDEPETPIDSE